MAEQMLIGGLELEVTFKAIKNIHLSVHPPNGRVRVAVPEGTDRRTLRAYLVTRLKWIRDQQAAIHRQERETPREYADRETHFVWGRRVLLRVEHSEQKPVIQATPRRLKVTVRPGTSSERIEELVAEWYRSELRTVATPMLDRWAARIGVHPSGLAIQHMKTKWGSCNPVSRMIRLNTELAKKPQSCLEYIVVHELVHLIEPTHNARFKSILARHLPDWKERKEALDRLPVRHEDWSY